MKKVLFSVLTFFAIANTATAQKISVADVEAIPGETVSFTMVVDVQGGTYVGFQTEKMKFPNNTDFTIQSGTANSAWSGGNVLTGALDASGVAGLSVVSTSDTAIPDGEFAIGEVSFTVASSAALGSYDVTITDIQFLDGTNYYSTNDVSFKVNVVAVHSVVLDENSTVAPVAASGVNVKVNRTISANEWSTICLPFAMSEAQCKAAFGDDVQLGDFTSYVTTKDGDKIVAIKVNFDAVTAVEANHPYIIKVSNEKNEFDVQNVNIEPAEKLSKEYKSGKKVLGKFVGTYVANFDIYNASDNYTLFLSDNKFYYSTENTKHMKAFRAYFDFNDALSSVENSSAPVFISFDNNTTGIKTISVSMSNDYYDIQGRKVENPSKGLYIKNGKKFVIK